MLKNYAVFMPAANRCHLTGYLSNLVETGLGWGA